MSDGPAYPEHEKLHAVQEKSQAQGEFIDWLQNEKGIQLSRWSAERGQYPVYEPIQDLLAEFHGINQAALETEKRAMLFDLQQAHKNRTSAH